MQTSNSQIVIFLILTTLLIVLLVATIVTILYLYQKKRVLFQDHISQAQLEIQEETFENISREIHDNISLSLTLAKLNLNTLPTTPQTPPTISSSIELISQAITDLSDISKNLNSEAICNHGLLNVLEMKVEKLKKSGKFIVRLNIQGQPVFMHSQKELLLYRISQEAINNIIKHANAKTIEMILIYTPETLQLKINDDGIGINYNEIEKAKSTKIMTGLSNIKKRTRMLNGNCEIMTGNSGTTICITVPIDKNEN